MRFTYTVQVNFWRPAGQGLVGYWATVNQPATFDDALALAETVSNNERVCTQVVEYGGMHPRVARRYGTQYPMRDVRTWARACPDSLLPQPGAPAPLGG